MRIGINGRFLIAKRTGVQRVAYNMLRMLLAIDRVNEYILFTGSDAEIRNSFNYPNVKIIASPLKWGESIRNHYWEQFVLPRLAKEYEVDILHSPANMAPLLYRGKTLVHIHDLCFLVNPQWYSFAFRSLYRAMIPRIVKNASRVITNSNSSKNDLLNFYELPADRVQLIYWAVDPVFQQQDHPIPVEMKDDYILCVGSIEPRKNLILLTEAFSQMIDRNPKLTTRLVIIGSESSVFKSVRNNLKHVRDKVVFTGFVSDSQLIQYYRHAKILAYPSLYEGFGLPPLEAMACGTPVLTSDTSSLPEVVGDAAVMVDPTNVGEISIAMEELLFDLDRQKELVKKGLERVKLFDWREVTLQVLSAYKELHRDQKGYVLSHGEWLGIRKQITTETRANS